MSQPSPLANFEGPKGVTVKVHDETKNYGYSNIFTVKLKVVANFPETGESFVRHLEKMGVCADDLERVREEMLKTFSQTGLPYLFKENFAQQLARANAKKPVRATGYLGRT